MLAAQKRLKSTGEPFKFREVLDRPIKKVPSLTGMNIVNLFFEDSTRTRISFEVAMTQLGGHSLILGADGSQMTRGESISDTAKVLSRYLDVSLHI